MSYFNPYLLTWRIEWAPNNASRWQMGFNPAFKRLINDIPLCYNTHNKTITLFHQKRNNSIWYWYFTVTTIRIFYLCTLAWRWSKERLKLVTVRYQYHIMLLCYWRNKHFFIVINFNFAARQVIKLQCTPPPFWHIMQLYIGFQLPTYPS